MKSTISSVSIMSRYICAFTIASTLFVSTVAQTTEPTPAPQDLSTNVSNESFVSFFYICKIYCSTLVGMIEVFYPFHLIQPYKSLNHIHICIVSLHI